MKLTKNQRIAVVVAIATVFFMFFFRTQNQTTEITNNSPESLSVSTTTENL